MPCADAGDRHSIGGSSGSDALFYARSKDGTKNVAGHRDKLRLSAAYIRSGRKVS